MKLQMKNQLTFQEKSGYPDDPCPVTEGDVKKQLMYWHDLLVKADEEQSLDHDLLNLEAFLYNLANGKVEYTDPARMYAYTAGFEYTRVIEVYAYSQEEADKKAKEQFAYLYNCMPPTIGRNNDDYGKAIVNVRFLERNDNEGLRIVWD